MLMSLILCLKVPIVASRIKTTCNGNMSVINAIVSLLFMTIQKTFPYLRKASNGNKGLNWPVCEEFYSANSKNYRYGQYKDIIWKKDGRESPFVS